ncbi:MAG: hypothetical protein K0Q60_4434, partial [Microvirga sp.]|nr:hypothetical protein [Microvirga sp.]
MTSARVRRPQARPPISVAVLSGWLARAKPGERLEYHRGFLALDRIKGPSLEEA